ncbi:MAG: cysteine--tRNA ligase [Gammaproteobacteria bacterium]|nr:MAG: cysteine--tRNA ligase [Gammaproteobacteria bacterium]
MLQIYNTLTRQKETFRPIDQDNVRMYVCGMTVYDLCHVGHARMLVVFDVVYRYLCHVYGKDHVTYVRNITDIDDKIIQRANENKEDFYKLTERFITAFHEDTRALGVVAPDQEPRATAYIDQIINMIEALVANGYAYVSGSSDVYFDVSRFDGYGKLSGKNPEDLVAGARVAVEEAKDDPLDFALWKSAKPEEPSWDSPWGAGRPGWHIECSAMSTHCLGHHFDIHGGGLDLQFPHHENEIAQSEGASGKKFVNVWMHNGFVRVDDEKMSKSLGNFFTIREVLKRYDPEVVRYFILTSHYRSPLNYSDQHLDNAQAALTTLYTSLRGFEDIEPVLREEMGADSANTKFFAAMNDDFNTPEALAALFEMAHKLNREKKYHPKKSEHYAGQLKGLAGLLGLLERDPEVFLKTGIGEEGLSATEVEDLIAHRKQARADKDWAEADRLRDELQDKGIVIEDSADGTQWRRG